MFDTGVSVFLMKCQVCFCKLIGRFKQRLHCLHLTKFEQMILRDIFWLKKAYYSGLGNYSIQITNDFSMIQFASHIDINKLKKWAIKQIFVSQQRVILFFMALGVCLFSAMWWTVYLFCWNHKSPSFSSRKVCCSMLHFTEVKCFTLINKVSALK